MIHQPVVALVHETRPDPPSAGAEVFATIRHPARRERLILDPVYSGRAFHGLTEEIRAGRFAGMSDLVFLHTGGIFGLPAQADQVESSP